jgi:adenylate kinase
MILIMGIAGSGKGTQGKLLAEKRGLQVVSTGELLRSYGSEDQHARMLKGVILGDEEVTEMLKTALAHLPSKDNVILDGYPRTIKQADWLLDRAREGQFKLEGVLLLEASPEAVTDRLKDRGRVDDHEAAIKARFSEYEQSTLPIIEHLSRAGVSVFKINGEQPKESVHQEIIDRLKPD